MTGHSEFQVIILDKKSNKTNLLVVLLKLLNVIFYDDTMASHRDEIESDELKSFVEIMIKVYRGTMTDTDRLIHRILTLLYDNQHAPAICSIQLAGSKTRSLTWIFNYLQPKDVYTTLSNFPFQRTQLALPFDFESSSAKSVHDIKVSEARALFNPSNFPDDEEEEDEDEEKRKKMQGFTCWRKGRGSYIKKFKTYYRT